jgi:hypothetical protein
LTVALKRKAREIVLPIDNEEKVFESALGLKVF